MGFSQLLGVGRAWLHGCMVVVNRLSVIIRPEGLCPFFCALRIKTLPRALLQGRPCLAGATSNLRANQPWLLPPFLILFDFFFLLERIEGAKEKEHWA